MGKNKQATCQICYKEMRSDSLKRHIKCVHNTHFKCNQCEFVINSWKGLKCHQKLKQGEPRPVYGGPEPEKEDRMIDQDESPTVINDGRNKQVTCKESDHLPTHMKIQSKIQDESKISHNTVDSMDELMGESIEVWKIYKLLQRMKKE